MIQSVTALEKRKESGKILPLTSLRLTICAEREEKAEGEK